MLLVIELLKQINERIYLKFISATMGPTFSWEIWRKSPLGLSDFIGTAIYSDFIGTAIYIDFSPDKV